MAEHRSLCVRVCVYVLCGRRAKSKEQRATYMVLAEAFHEDLKGVMQMLTHLLKIFTFVRHTILQACAHAYMQVARHARIPLPSHSYAIFPLQPYGISHMHMCMFVCDRACATSRILDVILIVVRMRVECV